MTFRNLPTLTVLAFVFLACDPESESVIPQQPSLIPVKMEATDGTRELEYDGQDRLTGLWMISHLPNGSEERNLQSMHYNDAGRLIKSTTDTGWRIEYTWENDRLVETNSFVSDQWSELYKHFYDARGRLIETRTFQDIPSEGGLIPVASEKFTYDNNDNVIEQRLFYFTSFGAEEKLLTVLTFSNYDSKQNSEGYFSFSPFQPVARLRSNNAGMMTVANAKGVVSSTNTYTYTYNEEGYAISKRTVVAMPGSADQEFETSYTFRK